MSVRSLTPREVIELRAKSKQPMTILDVREAWEYERVHLPDSVHIPMDDLRERLEDLDREQTYVILCHHGNRSLQVAGYMQSRGFKNVINLAGGIEDWAVNLEPGLARY
jgi:rhodanese-related sulfurtransferase